MGEPTSLSALSCWSLFSVVGRTGESATKRVARLTGESLTGVIARVSPSSGLRVFGAT
jgi:hypothetical protein